MQDCPILASLAPYTPEGKLTPGYGDHYLFFVGRDDVHGILKLLLPRESLHLRINMFGYDDEDLNAAIMELIRKRHVQVQISLDKSQAGGVHEKKILAMDEKADPEFGNSFCILQSETHQISHTKGGVLLSQGIWFEGSTNWSASGEGTGIALAAGAPNPSGYKAQNNTLVVSTNKILLDRFASRLDQEHKIGLLQQRNAKVRAPRKAQAKAKKR